MSRLLGVGCWWVALYAVWWALVGSWSPWAAVWGAAIAVLGTAAATVSTLLGRRRDARRPPGPGTAARHVASAARQVVVDFWVLVRVLAVALARGDRGPHGRFVLREPSPETATGERGLARRAWTALVATYSPNAWVAGVDPRTGRALVHDLEVRRDSEEPV